MAEIRFLGAARTVTGSRYHVSLPGVSILVDCGLFQGFKELRLRNWEPLGVEPASVDAVILTHAHIDHTGYLPRFVREGFGGPVYGTPGTVELSRILLPDSGRLQEEDARLANRRGYSKHKPALPLYTERDALQSLTLLQAREYGEQVALAPGVSFRFVSAGHILGSSFIEIRAELPGGARTILFSGDLGRYDAPILEDPSEGLEADAIVVESTYGNRLHGESRVKDQIAEVVNRTVARGGRIIVPAFAVGRAQEVLYYLRELEAEKRIPVVPVILDSPMAQAATQSYRRRTEDHDREMRELLGKHVEPLRTRDFRYARKGGRGPVSRGPAIVIAASGMATGGRVLRHLAIELPRPESTIMFVGYQANGTRGRRILNREPEVRIYGEMVPVKAEVTAVSGLSAHADAKDIIRWLSSFRRPPSQLFVTHGEPEAADALVERVRRELGWSAEAPGLGERRALFVRSLSE